MPIASNGHIFYEDEYTQKYEVQWETINGVIDITTIVMQPYVWGQQPEIRIDNGILYRRGIVTIVRQAIEVLSDGYVIIAEGSSQYEEYIQMNYPCEQGPVDNFKYHLNCSIIDDIYVKVRKGPRWADPDDDDDDLMIWADIDQNGTPLLISGTEEHSYLSWTDVWDN